LTHPQKKNPLAGLGVDNPKPTRVWGLKKKQKQRGGFLPAAQITLSMAKRNPLGCWGYTLSMAKANHLGF
jgi:hypothetical protein